MPKIVKIGQCFTELLKNNGGTFLYIEGNTVFELFICQWQKQKIFNCRI